MPFKIKIKYDDGIVRVYKNNDEKMTNIMQLSGYENTIINIVFRLAIGKINKNIKINFFIMDETFSYSDEHNITQISKLFDYMKKIYDWIIIVSHNEQIKNYSNTTINIKSDDGYSYIDAIKSY